MESGAGAASVDDYGVSERGRSVVDAGSVEEEVVAGQEGDEGGSCGGGDG